MFEYIRAWFQRHFSDPQVVILALLLLGLTAAILLMGRLLAPVIAGLVIAYLLEAPVRYLERVGVPRLVAVTIVFVVFLCLFFVAIFGLLPVLWRQLTQLVQEFPSMIAQGQQLLLRLPELYPQVFSEEQVRDLIAVIRSETGRLGQNVLSVSLAVIPGLIYLLIYAVLVPLLVFFFMKDKDQILAWFKSYLPRDHRLAAQVWQESNEQIGNYVRGKVWEIVIVGAASFVTFLLLGLNFAMLLGVLVGLSVVIPYIGAIVVTFPIALIAYFQWGWGPEFAYVMIAYALIQTLDANVLVPVLFSEVVNLHPVAIIVAILFFGGLWGFWGVFFAIPLATVVKAVLSAWPRKEAETEETQGAPPEEAAAPRAASS